MNRKLSLRLSVAAAALLALILAPASSLAQTKTGELPITTASKPALALFQQAREKMDNAETTAAAPLLDQAIQKDPNFAMAYAYRAFAGGGFNVLLSEPEQGGRPRGQGVAGRAPLDPGPGGPVRREPAQGQAAGRRAARSSIRTTSGSHSSRGPSSETLRRTSAPLSGTTRRRPPWTRGSPPPTTRSAMPSPGSATTRRRKRRSSSTSPSARALPTPTTPTPSSS